MSSASLGAHRALIGVRVGRRGPVLWCDPCGFDPEPGQRVLIVTDDGERMARVSVGRTPVPSLMLVPQGRVARIDTDEKDAAHLEASLVAVDVPERSSRRAPALVNYERIATLIKQLLIAGDQPSDTHAPPTDLGEVLTRDVPEDESG